jgi:hypothetical protein
MNLEDGLYLDSTQINTPAKFINDGKHSNVPCNVLFHLLKIENVQQIWIQAIRDIEANEELLVDYGDSYWEETETNKSKEQKEEEEEEEEEEVDRKIYFNMQSPEKSRKRRRNSYPAPLTYAEGQKLLLNWMDKVEKAVNNEEEMDVNVSNMPETIKRCWQLIEQIKKSSIKKQKKEEDLRAVVLKPWTSLPEHEERAKLLCKFLSEFKSPLDMDEDDIKAFLLLANVQKSKAFYKEIVEEKIKDDPHSRFKKACCDFLRILWNAESWNGEVVDKLVEDILKEDWNKEDPKLVRKNCKIFLVRYLAAVKK